MSGADPAYLAIDLGASSCRAILGTLRKGCMEMVELHRFATPIVEEEGHLYWDIHQIWNEMQVGLGRATDASGSLRSVSVDSWGVDFVPLDQHGEPVRRPFCYRDPRTEGMLAHATSIVPRGAIYHATGIQFMEINTLYQVLADKQLDEPSYRKTRNRLLIADYFNYRLSGQMAAERSLASTSQLMRAGEPAWAVDLMDAFQLDPATWPVIVESATVLGPLLDSRDVTVVAGCSHDTACAVAAAPATDEREDWAFLSCGTWSLLGMERASPLLTSAAHEAGFTNEAGFGGTIRFLKNMTGLWILQECERAWREAGIAVDYEGMQEEAKNAPMPARLLDVREPSFSHRADMPALINTMCNRLKTPQPASRGAVVRLILESLAEGHRRTLRELEALLETRIRTLYMVGGGSLNELLCQYTANRCGCRVVAGPSEATALGNLLIQAHAMDDLSAEEIRHVARHSSTLQTYEPAEGTDEG